MQGQVALLTEKAGINPPTSKNSSPAGTPSLTRKHSHDAMKPSIHAKNKNAQQSPHGHPGLRSALRHESTFANRHSRRNSQDLRRLNLIDPGYGGSPRSNKNSNSNSNGHSSSESPQSKPSKLDSMNSPKSGSRSGGAATTQNKISFFGRAQAPGQTLKKSTFTVAAKEALDSGRSFNERDSSRQNSARQGSALSVRNVLWNIFETE